MKGEIGITLIKKPEGTLPRRDISQILALDRNGRNVEMNVAGSNGRFCPN